LVDGLDADGRLAIEPARDDLAEVGLVFLGDPDEKVEVLVVSAGARALADPDLHEFEPPVAGILVELFQGSAP
jgi:hypothetical protein